MSNVKTKDTIKIKNKNIIRCPYCDEKVHDLDLPIDFVSSIVDNKGNLKPGEYHLLLSCSSCEKVFSLSLTPLDNNLQVRDINKLSGNTYAKLVNKKLDKKVLLTYIDDGKDFDRISWEEYKRKNFPTLKDFKKEKKALLNNILDKISSLKMLKENLLEDKLLEDYEKTNKIRNLLEASQYYIYKFVLDNGDKFKYYHKLYEDEIKGHKDFYKNFKNEILLHYNVDIDGLLNISFVKETLGFLKELFSKDLSKNELISNFEEKFGVSYNEIRNDLISTIKGFYDKYMDELKKYSKNPEDDFKSYYGKSYDECINTIDNEISIFDVFLHHIQSYYFKSIEEKEEAIKKHEDEINFLIKNLKKLDAEIVELEEILKDPLKDPNLYNIYKRVLKNDQKAIKLEINKLEKELRLKSLEIEKNINNYIKENYGNYTINELISILEEKINLLKKFDKCSQEEKEYLLSGPVSISEKNDKNLLKLQKHIYFLKSLEKWIETKTSNININLDSSTTKKINRFISRKLEEIGIKDYNKLSEKIMSFNDILGSLKKRKFDVYKNLEGYYTLVSSQNKIYLFFDKNQTSESINEAVYNLIKLCVNNYIKTLDEHIEIEIFGKPSEVSFVKRAYKIIKKMYDQKINEFIDFLNDSVKDYIKKNPDANLKKLFNLMPELKSYKLFVPNDFFIKEIKSILKKKNITKDKINFIYEKFLNFREKYANIFKFAYYGFSALMSSFIPFYISKLVSLKIDYDSYKSSYSSISMQYENLSQSIKEPDSTKVSMLTDILDTFESVFIGQGEKGFGERGIDEMAFLTDSNCPYYYNNQYLTSDCILGNKGDENPLWIGNPNWEYYGLDKFIPQYSEYLKNQDELHSLSTQLNDIANKLTNTKESINNTELMLGVFMAPIVALGAYYAGKKLYNYIKKKKEGPVGLPSGRDLYVFSGLEPKFV